MLFGGRRIYARVFHAKIDDAGYKRLGRTVIVPSPDHDALREHLRRADAMAGVIEGGTLAVGVEEEVPPGLAALIEGVSEAAKSGANGDDCARAALAALSRVAADRLPPRPPPPADGSPVTAVSPMLAAASAQPVPGPDAEGHPSQPIDPTLVRRLITIETASGLSVSAARAAAMLALAERDAGLARGRELDPPPMSAEAFAAALRTVLAELLDLRARLVRSRAA